VNERDNCAPVTAVAVNTTVPVREVAPALAWVVNTTDPFPEPPDGLTVTQLGAVTTQEVFEVTVRVLDTTPAVGFHAVVGAIVKVGGGGAAWLTVMVLDIAGLPTVLLNITVALRIEVVRFGSAVNTTVPSPLPVDGDTDNQGLVVQVPVSRQSVFEDTAMVWLPPLIAVGFQTVVGETVNVAGTPA